MEKNLNRILFNLIYILTALTLLIYGLYLSFFIYNYPSFQVTFLALLGLVISYVVIGGKVK